MNRVFGLVIQISIYGSIAGALILLIKAILKENLTYKWCYLLWLVLVIKLLFPFGPKSDFSIFNKVESSRISIDTVKNHEYSNDLSKINRKVSKQNEIITNSQSEYEKTKVIDSNYNSSNSKIDFYTYISKLWIVISISMFSFIIITYINLNISLYNNKNENYNSKLHNVLEECKTRLNIKRKIIISESEHIKTPAITGILIPKIIIPISLINLSERELKHVFLHELAHYKRKDNIINLCLLLIQSIHWFNPFIFYYFKILRNDMELATDEKALSILKFEEYNNYGTTLLNILSKMNSINAQPNILGMAKNKQDLEKRIMNIKNLKYPKRKKSSLTTIGTLVLMTASILILTDAQSPSLSFADIDKNKNIQSYELNGMQNSFFNIVNYMEENKNILVEEMRNFNNNLKLEKTEQLGKKDRVDVYTLNNEEIKVYYERRDGQGAYYTRNVEYNLNNKDKDISLIRLSDINIAHDEKTIELQLGTESLEELYKNVNLLDINYKNSELFKVYYSLLKEIEANEGFNSKDLASFNSNFIYADSNVFIMSDDINEIRVGFNEDNGKVAHISFYDFSSDEFNRQNLTTKTKNMEYKEWDIQEHYENEYNFEKSNTGHIVTVDNEDIEDAKGNFIKFISNLQR